MITSVSSRSIGPSCAAAASRAAAPSAAGITRYPFRSRAIVASRADRLLVLGQQHRLVAAAAVAGGAAAPRGAIGCGSAWRGR